MIRQMSGAEIAFNLKDEKGDVVPVEIDGIEEEVCERTPTPEKKVSIQQRVLKARNSEQQMSIIAASRENRKQEWVELLDEHAQIVNEVNCLEGVGDKENINGPSDGAAQIS
ncbi:DgyrCDS13100 [Dimorphilus gyrociliatus]|uniref:DgyrCDS13100 n=1 Tax=Dimorphilus gyrociliatus TaxID=2664684 RepID=A0A7I8W9M3_9ANNE|nr:DgyrCDS13100 [Dimorphilus gyrociliatus]